MQYSPTFVGFFVYRHLGLLGCNIVLMKHFLLLLMLTGLLFGQDVLNLKSGESYNNSEKVIRKKFCCSCVMVLAILLYDAATAM